MSDREDMVNALQARLDAEMPTAEIVCLDTVERTEVEWLWPGRIALGKLSLISGNPGLGKSTLALTIATHVSLGSRWPVAGGNSPKGDTLILSAEDDIADTILPRLEAAGAEKSRIHALKMVRFIDPQGEHCERLFSLERDIDLLDKELAGLGDCRLVIIDPISAYMGNVDSHKNSDVRGLLAPLADVAQRRGVAIIGVTHLNKGGGKAIYRTMGSLAYVAAARAVWGVAEDENCPGRMLVLPVKNNLAPTGTGLAYGIASNERGDSYLVWEAEPVDASMDEMLYQDDERSAVDEAANWLRDVLSDGRVGTQELQKLASRAGHSWRTVQRAKNKIGAEAQREGFGREGRFYWHLPIEDQPPTPALAAYEETRASAGFQPTNQGGNSHRPPALDTYGDGSLYGDEEVF